MDAYSVLKQKGQPATLSVLELAVKIKWSVQLCVLVQSPCVYTMASHILCVKDLSLWLYLGSGFFFYSECINLSPVSAEID